MKKIIDHLQAEWYKYVLEILVLIIGIYGAFALENWNDDRKSDIRNRALLTSLLEDLEEDKHFFEGAYQTDLFRFHSLNYLLEQIGVPKEEFGDVLAIPEEKPERSPFWSNPIPTIYDSAFLEKTYQWLGRVRPFLYNKKIMDELERQGIFYELSNRKLEKALTSYYQNVEWRFNRSDERQAVEKYYESFQSEGIYVGTLNLNQGIELFRKSPHKIARLRSVVNGARWRCESASKCLDLLAEAKIEIEKELAE